jgi:hypothetical protein
VATQLETDVQFLARMLVSTREGQQIPGHDARRLNNLATYGDSLLRGDAAAASTTMPEERRSGSELPGQAGTRDVVRG